MFYTQKTYVNKEKYMMLNDYQKQLIAEGFYSRLKEESTSDKKIEMILEFMESFIPKGLPSTIPMIRDCTRFDQGTIPSPAFTATQKEG